MLTGNICFNSLQCFKMITTLTYSDYLNWYRSKFGSLKPDPTMWRKYVDHIDLNRKTNTYCALIETSYNQIASKLKAFS